MIPNIPSTDGRSTEFQTKLEAVHDRIDTVEDEQHRLLNTIDALARETDSTVCGPCTECNEAYLLLRKQTMYCPKCRNERIL